MLDKLSRKHNKWISTAFNLCKNKQDAEDLVQDMYVKVHNRKIPSEKLTDGYVYFILLNSFKDKFKKNISFIDIDSLIDQPSTSQSFELEDKDIKVLQYIDSLSEFDKRILKLHSEGDTYESIAEREGTYKVDVFRRIQSIRLKILKNET